MKKIHKQIFRYYWTKISNYPIYLVAIMVGQIGGIADDMLAPFIYKLIIDHVSAGPGDYQTILFYLLITLVSGLTLANFWRIAGFASLKMQARNMKEISDECFDYLHNHSYNFFSNNFTGSLVKKVNRFTSSYEGLADRITWGIVPLTIRTAIVLAIFVTADWRISAAFLIWLGIYAVCLRWYLNWHVKFDTDVAEQGTRVTGQLADSITNFANVKFFSNLPHEIKRFQKLTESLSTKMIKSWGTAEWFFAFQTILMVLGEIGIMYLTLRLWNIDLISIGTFVLVQVYLLQVMHRIWDLSHVFKDIYTRLADAEEMMEIYNQKHEIRDLKSAKQLKVTRGEIKMIDVTYDYVDGKPVFDKLSLKIKPQEKIALVGHSGAGKSTFVKLLLRFYNLNQGQILIDGQDIRKVTQASLRDRIAFVPQDSVMFHRTIMENIRYGRLDATDAEVIQAAKLARCHDFIMASPKQYDTKVGERGIKLSGGERQRIAIARAILKNAPILILDEATSSLDSKSEKLIQEALHELMHNKTVIAIAHRLSTIKEMDRIIVLENGNILEEGRHEDLLKQDAHYAELWNLQANG